MAAITMMPEVLRLWSGDAPGALGKAEQDVPTITVFRPEKPCGSVVVVCPGGGYGMLADYEGTDYAKFLVRFGVTAVVLKYRLGTTGYRHPAMLNDATRAVRMVRYHAKEWGIDPTKVGIMGSSAGGHLAATLMTHWHAEDDTVADPIDRLNSRPDFGVLCYPVISFGPYGHGGSRELLIGKDAPQSLIDDLSAEKQVNAKTPTAFIWTTSDDAVVPSRNATLFADALVAAKVPVELHIYPHGDHGLALGGDPKSDHLLPWTGELIRWMRENGWAK